jgi:hypothetical protein
MTDWFRSWHGAPTDNKWLVIGRRAGVAPGVASAVGWALMDYASQQDDRGSIDGFDVETYAIFSGWEEDAIHSVIVAMTEKGMIASGRLSAWEKRQPEREDAGAAERKRRQRERDMSNKEEVTQCHAASRSVTQRHAPEERESREEEIREDTVTSGGDIKLLRTREAQPDSPRPLTPVPKSAQQERAAAAQHVKPPPADAEWLELEVAERAAAAGISPKVLLAELDVGRETKRWRNRDKSQRISWRNWMDNGIGFALERLANKQEEARHGSSTVQHKPDKLTARLQGIAELVNGFGPATEDAHDAYHPDVLDVQPRSVARPTGTDGARRSLGPGARDHPR